MFLSSRFCGAARFHNRKQHPARARAKEVGSMLVELGVVEVVTVVVDVIVLPRSLKEEKRTDPQ